MELIHHPLFIYITNIYNKDNTDIILWLKQCSLFDSKYLKGKKVYYNEDKEENYCYKTIFITQD